ncbi:uncharacterized protein DUF4836 [Kordia periserrulae]|uniref:Uncharacterized protein DUF4836 n=1 Tax=Kordia periserrulae TaxID=701523 RepID=A0A2T6BYU0_9FLAO|nr:DUF4836 family protein [Kordia periserrulae]PTX61137.1 uncharacterized protein DUF4836 [Kordia periserrulae]
MKKIVFLFTIALLVISCGKKNSESSYIPKDAAGVMYVNLGSLAAKSQNVDFKDLHISKMIEQSAPRKMKAFLEEQMTAENINAAFRKEFLLGFMVAEGRAGYGGLIIPIKDAASFEKMIMPMLQDLPRAEKQENVGKNDAFTVYSSRDMAIGWNNETALIVAGSRYPDQDLIDLTKMEASENIYATNYYKSFFDTSMDMGMHVSSTPLKEMGDAMASMFTGKNSIELGDNNFAYYGNFEDDRILTKATLKLNKDIKSLTGYESWAAKGYESDLLNVLPSNPAMVFKVSLDPTALYKHFESLQDNELIPEMFRTGLKTNLQRTNKEMKREIGMTMEDITGLFDGSMMLAVTEGITKKDSIRDYYSDDEEYQVFETKIPYMYGAVAIKDMDKFETLVNKAMEMKRPENTKGKNYYELDDNVFVMLKDNVLFITNDESKADEVYNNGKLAANLSSFEHKSKLDNSIYMYMSENAYKMFSDMANSMNPYASMYGNNDTMSTTYEKYGEFFGDTHFIMNADGMETFTYTKGDGNSLERTIDYMDAALEETMKMMSRY